MTKESRLSLARLGGFVVAIVVGIAGAPAGPLGLAITIGAVVAFRTALWPWVDAGKEVQKKA